MNHTTLKQCSLNIGNPKKVKINSVMLVRNIANESKREPLKLATIVKVHDSSGETQRVVTLTYHNVKQNKDGEWIGKPVKVDRSINNLVLVDNALNKSMLNPIILKGNDEIHRGKDMNNDKNDRTLRKLRPLDFANVKNTNNIILFSFQYYVDLVIYVMY